MTNPKGPRVPKQLVIAFARLIGEDPRDCAICYDIEQGLKTTLSQKKGNTWKT